MLWEKLGYREMDPKSVPIITIFALSGSMAYTFVTGLFRIFSRKFSFRQKVKPFALCLAAALANFLLISLIEHIN